MNNFNITVSEPESSIAVPDTGMATIINPTTAILTGFGIMAFIMICSCIVLSVHKRKESHRVFQKNSRMKLRFGKRTFIGFSIIALTSLGLIGGLSSENGNKQKPALAIADPDTLTISAEDINLKITLEDETAFGFVASNIKVTSGTSHGYTLGVYASGTNIVSEENEEKIVSGLQASESPLGLSNNTWGITTTLPEDETSKVWYAMPTTQNEMFIIKTTSQSTPANDVAKLYYGAFITDELPYGTYDGPSINYVAVANQVPPDIAVEWFDGSEPGATHNVKIYSGDPSTFAYTYIPGCSIVNEEECPAKEDYAGIIPASLEKEIVYFYQQLDFSHKNTTISANNLWFGMFEYLANPTNTFATKDEPCDNKPQYLCDIYNDTIEADTNDDGVITYLEYANYLAYYSIPDALNIFGFETILTWTDEFTSPTVDHAAVINPYNKYIYTWSLICAEEDCPTSTNTGRIPASMLDQVMLLSTQLEPEMNRRLIIGVDDDIYSAISHYFSVFDYLSSPTKYIFEGCSSDSTDSFCKYYQECKSYDIDHDGNITYLEYANYLVYKEIPSLLE